MIIKLLLIFTTIHLLLVVISMVLCINLGVFEEAEKHGDGIRLANKSDIISSCVVCPCMVLLNLII